jgi:hypothetical protein
MRSRLLIFVGLMIGLVGCDDDTSAPRADAAMDAAVRQDAAPRDAAVDAAVRDSAQVDSQTQDSTAVDGAIVDGSDAQAGDAGADGSDATIDAAIDAAADGGIDAVVDLGPDAVADAETDGFHDESRNITGLLPYSGEVGPNGFSGYRIDGVTGDAVYTISLQRTDGLPFPSVPNAGGSGSIACGWNDDTEGGTILCAIRAPSNGSMHFNVRGDDTIGGTFVLTYSAGGHVNEGSNQNPVDVSSFPLDGECLNQSYYRLTGLTPGSGYELAFTANSVPVRLFVFPDDTYQSNPSDCSAQPGGSCTVQPDTSGYIYMIVDQPGSASGAGASYTISVTEQ